MTETRPSYEEAREELVDVVRRLESGGTDLEESLALWERGEKLAEICQGWLDGARKRLDAAVASRDGSGDGAGDEDDGLTGARRG
jgi:exodeoxyribonuclease VII small subunit